MGSGWRCAAFPNRIPHEIIDLRFDHRQPHPDDQGIQFEMYETHDTLDASLSDASDKAIKELAEEEFSLLDKGRKEGMSSLRLKMPTLKRNKKFPSLEW